MSQLKQSPAKLMMNAIAEKLQQDLPEGTLVKHNIMIDENKQEKFFEDAKKSRNKLSVFVSYLGSQFDSNGGIRVYNRDPQIVLMAVANDPDGEHEGYLVHDLIETCLDILYEIGLSPVNEGYMPRETKDRNYYAGILIMEVDSTKFAVQTKVHQGFTFPEGDS